MTYKALVFDFFGVLCTDISPFWFEEHFAEKGKELREQYMWPADRGSISQQELFRELAAAAGVTPQEIENDWESHIRFNAELIELIRELKENHKIGLVSNATSSFFHTAMALSGAAPLFDAVVVSSEVGHVKPEPEIYAITLEKLGVAPGEALMIDDSQTNVDGAVAAGMHGHRFSSVEDLKKFLART